MSRLLVTALFILMATPAEAWDWDLHYRIAVAAGIPPSAAHGVSYPDMSRHHDRLEEARHYMNADFFPPAFVLGSLPITYATFAAQVTLPEKMGYLLYEILYYAAAYRADRALLRHGDFNENLLRLAHYAADLFMPLHLTRNHDGQETGQRGAHERLEDFADARVTTVKPLALASLQSDADLWRTLQSEAARSRALAEVVLASDAAAKGCGRPYDDCFGARDLMRLQADRAAGFLVALRAYLETPLRDAPRYEHRE